MGERENNTTSQNTGGNSPQGASTPAQSGSTPVSWGTVHTSSYHGTDVQTPETGDTGNNIEKRGE